MKSSVYDSLRGGSFKSNKDRTKWWCLHFFRKKWTKWTDWQFACSWDMDLTGHWTGTRYAGKATTGFVLGSLDGTSHFLGERREPDLLVQRELMPIMGWFLRPTENLFLMEVSGTRGYLSDELLKTCCQVKWDSNMEIQWILEWESLALLSTYFISVIIWKQNAFWCQSCW